MAKRSFILSECFAILMCMKNIFFIALLSLFLIGCNSTPKVSETPVEKKTDEQQNKSESVAAHTTEKEKDAEASKTAPGMKPPKSGEKDGKAKPTSGGTAIDVSDLTKVIKLAKAKSDANPSDEELKKNLSKAYTNRGIALTAPAARQYAAAVGDYRKALKADSSNKTAKTWINQIAGIYKSLPGKEIPKEGEEPEPLEYKKVSTEGTKEK